MSSIKKSNEIREVFTNYFRKNSHYILESSNVVPENDNSILFTNAGMVQFKNWFTGEIKPKKKNVATIQKCLRAGGKHNDLDNVGFTPRHHTFFEMLGNFSFGGYFKDEAIHHAWNLLTKEFGLDTKKLIITVFKDDNESLKIWKKISGFSDSQIIKISTSDNFWSMGDSGPCGPCSEIFFDNGDKISGGLPGTKNQDGDRFIEIWNLVFMEFEKKESELKKLPCKCVDTGMGLERLTAVLNNEINNYDTDLYINLIKEVEKLSEIKKNKDNLSSFRIISDHIKSITFLMSEGVLPSNEGRGYVLRRIIRRALLHCHKLNKDKKILSNLLNNVIEDYSSVYYSLSNTFDFIYKNLKIEEDKFCETLSNGLQLLNKEINEMKGDTFAPSVAFKLYDTYGFPLDMTESILLERKIKLDKNEYLKIVKDNKNLQKNFVSGEKVENVNKILSQLENVTEDTKFCGYDKNKLNAKLLKIIVNDKFKDEVENEENIILIFDKTPFYGESGGQIGDSGKIFNSKDEIIAEISNTKILNKFYLHHIEKLKSKITCGVNYFLSIDLNKRERIKNNHTATHLLHQSLRQVLGAHVSQKGSLVNEEKLRFDYTSSEQLSQNQLQRIESIVNTSIRSNISSTIKFMPLKKAINSGAIALFGEKYPESVRVISFKNIDKDHPFESIELCGGTHVESTGQIGFFKVLSDSSISSGVRRIEAVTGKKAESFISQRILIIEEIKKLLKANDSNLMEKLKSLKEENLKLKKNNQQKKDFFSKDNLMIVNETNVYYQELDCEPKELKNNSDIIQSKISSGIVIISCVQENKVSIVTSVSKDLLNKYDSNKIIKKVVTFLGGSGGGGRKDLAQGGAQLSKKFKELKSNTIEFL